MTIFYFDLTIIFIKILNKHNDNTTLITHRIINNIIKHINTKLTI